MKNVNRKVMLTLLGLVLVVPFLAIATVIGKAVALANVRTDWPFLGLALVSVAVGMIQRHKASTDTSEKAERCVKRNGTTDLRGASSVSLGY